MSIDRIYREFFGFSLIIISLFLFVSLVTFSAQDNVNNLLTDSKNYLNNFGYLGALFSSTVFSYIGFAAYYFALICFYFGMILFFSSSSNNFSERLNFINNVLYSFISIFPLTLFFISFFNSANTELSLLSINSGGLAGDNLSVILNTYANSLVVGSISGIVFLTLQYFIFYDLLNSINAFFKTDKISEKKQSKPRNIVKEVEKPKVSKPKESTVTETPKPDPINVEQEDFIDLLDKKIDDSSEVTKDYLDNLAENLVNKLEEFGIEGRVEGSLPGPVITRFEISLAPGTKASQVSNIANDLARSLAVKSVRVVEVIEGKSSIGIEIPNPKRKVVTLYSSIHQHATDTLNPLEFCIGKDIAGESAKIDLQQLPHLLIAGTTGSGKSVGVNTILLNLLRNNSPANLKLLLIDPKMLELSVYDDIPHLITPVITDMQKAANGLNWCVKEMDKRYKLMSILGVRNLEGYNQKAAKPSSIPQEQKELLLEELDGDIKSLPYIVVVIDELADLMMVTGKKVEQLIARLAQKARASGIHLAIATQRPSVDVITGLIKANIPSRMSFLVSSKVDSRTILDQGGAEQLLGKGDMLFIEPGTSIPKRIHGAFVKDDEVQKITKYLRETGKPEYIEEVTKAIEIQELQSDSDTDDDLYNEAVEFVVETRRASISSIQRKFRIGYNRAARLIETMEENGIVTPMNSNGSREVI
ncbi:MAG: DNA translocase FtsK 4TM domain-containing protein [Pseudomonadota bacterium]|nr:DNA translocase FtsK 4TM domain-containing protein [Pseudomonadota bacterium]